MNFKQASEHKIHLKLGDTSKFEVEQDFVWYINFENKNEYVIIPRGFQTDIGTIPWILRPFIDYTYLGYIIHDYLYNKKAQINIIDLDKLSLNYRSITIGGDDNYGTISRRQSDKILISALEIEGMGSIRRTIVYLGVRIFGSLFYKK